jgi:hypothetical protein
MSEQGQISARWLHQQINQVPQIADRGPCIYGKILVPTTTIDEQNKLNQMLQQQLRESNRAQFAMAGGRVQ